MTDIYYFVGTIENDIENESQKKSHVSILHFYFNYLSFPNKQILQMKIINSLIFFQRIQKRKYILIY